MAVWTNFDIRIDQDLANHPLMKGKNVRIQREKRRVILEGDVDSYYDKQMLQEVLEQETILKIYFVNYYNNFFYFL